MVVEVGRRVQAQVPVQVEVQVQVEVEVQGLGWRQPWRVQTLPLLSPLSLRPVATLPLPPCQRTPLLLLSL